MHVIMVTPGATWNGRDHSDARCNVACTWSRITRVTWIRGYFRARHRDCLPTTCPDCLRCPKYPWLGYLTVGDPGVLLLYPVSCRQRITCSDVPKTPHPAEHPPRQCGTPPVSHPQSPAPSINMHTCTCAESGVHVKV